MKNEKNQLKIFSFVIFVTLFFFAQAVSAQVVINEVQLLPTGERFIELYNSGSSDVDLTGWYIQRKTATGSTFGSLVSKPNFDSKKVLAGGYFLISRNQLEKSNITVNDLTLTESNSIQIKNSAGEVVDKTEWGTVESGKSYQRTSSGGWEISTPTPGEGGASIIDASSSYDTTSSDTYESSSEGSTVASVQSLPAPRISKIMADAGPKNRVALVGASILFEGRVTGINKELIENTQMKWSFGDGSITEGWGTKSVTHVYHYTGEYNVFLEAPALFVTSDRVRVRVIAPQIMLRLGGDMSRSFISLENRSSDELDMTGWKIFSGGKLVTLPRMILSAKKIVTLPSEATNLSTPEGTLVELRFPNGVSVPLLQNQVLQDVVIPSNKVVTSAEVKLASPKNDLLDVVPQNQQNTIKSASVTPVTKPLVSMQQASVINALTDTVTSGAPITTPKDESSWPWYIAVAFIGAIAALGLRFVRSKSTIADEFEITEDKDDKPF